MSKIKRKKNKGVSLVELLVALATMGILLASLLNLLPTPNNDSNLTTEKSIEDRENLTEAVESYTEKISEKNKETDNKETTNHTPTLEERNVLNN